VSLLIAVTACRSDRAHSDTTTSGDVRIAVDVSLQPVLDTEVFMFESTYKYAKIRATYTNEADAVNLLLNDSVRLAVIPRKLTKEEEAFLTDQQKITPRYTPLAYDAIAVIVHPENSDTDWKLEELKSVLSGTISSFSKVHPKHHFSNGDEIKVVVDQANSSIVRYVLDSLLKEKKLGPHVFAAGDNAAVIDYVSKTKNAVGLISLAWISDRDDSTANTFLKKVNVVALAPEGSDEYLSPFQYYLYKQEYPLTRKIFIVSREARAGLGTGFAAFLAGDKGQKIILKADLLPASAPVRLIEVRKHLD